MAEARDEADRPLKIVHVLRAPLGGLFRHVVDLTREQVRRGHAVGLVTDASTGGETADALLRSLEPSLALGLSRVAMRRNPAFSDLHALAHTVGRMRVAAPDIVHGHGSKGGVFARVSGLFPGATAAVRAYTPHGGSLNHHPGSTAHRLYMAAERLLALKTDLLLFESEFIAGRYETLVGKPRVLARIVHNGLSAEEFEPVSPCGDAADFLYVGELREAKGIDLFLAALADFGRRRGVLPRAVLVGSGPDRASLEDHARRLGLANGVAFAGPLPARRAFELGRVLVVPSRMESLPYIALEAAAARMPLVSTDVGGIPEIFGPFRHRLVPPDNVARLTERMLAVHAQSPEVRAAAAAELAAFVRGRFSIGTMVDTVIDAYREALARKPEISIAPRRRSAGAATKIASTHP